MASDLPHSADEIFPVPEQQDKRLAEEDGHGLFPIVGIGASAGGLEAYQQLLTNLPEDTGMAFVLVQHLDPHHQSRLADLLVRFTPMPIIEAVDDMAVQPNHIYIIPPNSSLAIVKGVLHVTRRSEGRGPHLPIDNFFRSLAEDQKTLAVGVVLSGTGSDGTQGLCEIKAGGGITFAQDERSAKYSGMPQCAAESGCADLILPAEGIAGRLAQMGSHPYLIPTEPEKLSNDSTSILFRRVLHRIRSVTGIDFSLYRDTTIKRRVMRRMALFTQESLGKYVQRLERDQGEVNALYHDLLINVTSFFRDPALFEALKQQVYPKFIEGAQPTKPVRVWVPGCSTGQEAYSIAMSLVEFFDAEPFRPPIQIFATDIGDAAVLDKARAGVYPDTIEAEIDAERLRRFFHKEDTGYRIDKSLRDLCVFARQNLACDPPFSHVDLISCRNVLIYLSTPLQKRIMPTFHYALNVPGFLLLGSSETVGENTDLFEFVEHSNRIYRKIAVQTQPYDYFLADEFRDVAEPAGQRVVAAGTPMEFQREADRLLLGRFGPPSVLINENLDIIQFRGRTSAYLESPPGDPTTNLLKMAREGLFLDLRSAITEARRTNQAVRRDGLQFRSNGVARTVDIEVIPVKPIDAQENGFLVLFENQLAPESMELEPAPVEPAEAEAIGQLRKELDGTKEYLQTLIEQQDVANEELRSANEEILSSNEELQSTNEELETAKEELQSTNEELTTVNEQLQHRNFELNELNDDLGNLLTSTTIPVVMVGPNLCIRRFTQPARRVMNLLSSDIGRPISDLQTHIDIDDLDRLIQKVIEEVKPQEREVRDRDGRWHTLRVHPYRTSDHRIDGAVIMILDIDDTKKAAIALSTSEERLRLALEAGAFGTWHIDLKTDRVYWDERMHLILGLGPESPREGERFFDALSAEDQQKLRAALRQAIEQSDRLAEELRFDQSVGSSGWLSLSGKVFFDELGAPARIAGVGLDISAQKRSQAALDRRMEELKEADREKNEFLAMLAHELRNPLAPISNAVEVLKSLDSPDAKLTTSRDIIAREVQHMGRMLEDLVDLSRLTRDRLVLRKTAVKLADIVGEAITTSKPSLDVKRHRLSLALPPQDVWLDADPMRLCQVFSNLLINAAKFTRERGQISFAADVEAEAVAIHVCDNGIGIPKELLGRIFDIFAQGDGGVQGGLGIGLSLVKSLVQLHNGSIEAKSDGNGKGSEFIVRLPIIAPSAERPASPAKLPHADSQPQRILVVDDNTMQATTLSMLLKSYGHEVRTTSDGPAALAELASFVPDIALIDLGLPIGMTGYDLARRIRAEARFAHTLLIAQTGWGRDEDRKRSHAAGFDFHLVKPLDHDRLRRIIARVETKN